ncbi:MAG: CBS domain-containing protein [Herpetosiphonaceae bacterium]|nr:CBS domain-containing protein [Herpetosiphonaceae bacterium]
MSGISIRALMSAPVIAVSPQTRLPHIKSRMEEHHIRRLPVVEHDHLIGIISLGDVRNALPSDAITLSIYELTSLLYKITAKDLMRTPVITIEADAPLLEAAQCMLQQRVSGLPVLQNGQLVGMVTESDIFRALVGGQVALPESYVVVADEERGPMNSDLPLV